MIITISGVSGSGKSTTAILLAKKLGFQHYSMGDLQRELAKKHGMGTVEFSKLEAKDPKYDKERDEILIKLGREKDNFVIDTWLGAKFIPNAKKIFLQCDIDVRAQRIFEESKKGGNRGKNASGVRHKRKAESKYKSLGEAKKAILKKEEINRKRWLKYYSFDFMDKKNYDLVIDTTKLTIEGVVDKIHDFIKK